MEEIKDDDNVELVETLVHKGTELETLNVFAYKE